MCVTTDRGAGGDTTSYVAACEDGTTGCADACFTADGTTNKWNDGTDDWWYWTVFPSTLDSAWSAGSTWCWNVETTQTDPDLGVENYAFDAALCHTFAPYSTTGPEALFLGPDFWMPYDYVFDQNIEHNGLHGTWAYLTQDTQIDNAILNNTVWDVVDFTEHYDGLSAINFPGDNKAKRMDWHKMVHYNEDITGEVNNVFNGMTAAEWRVEPFDHEHPPFADLNDTWTDDSRRVLPSLYTEEETGQGNCEGDPDCWRMPSVTESIDGGVCGLVVWRAYPRMVDSDGDITNRAYMWLQGGFADDEIGAYRLRRGRGCGGGKGKNKRALKEPTKSNGKAVGHEKNGNFQGYCPFDKTRGTYDMTARASRDESPCGEGVDFSLSGYLHCATTLDAQAAAGGRRMLADEEWDGVTVTPTWEGDAIDAIIEECDNVTGECKQTDVVSGDSYTFNFDDDVSYNFVATNEYGDAALVEMHYQWFQGSGATGLVAASAFVAAVAALF